MGQFKNVKVIVNPTAKRGFASRLIPSLHQKLQALNLNYSLCTTRYPEDAVAIAKKACQKKFDVIAAVGGDGTVNEVINGIGFDGPPLCIIPAGTGNDLARSLGIPLNPLQAVSLLEHWKISKIDLGQEKDRIFSIIAGIGFPAEVMQRTNEYRGIFKGPGAIAFNVIKTISLLKPQPVELELDDCSLVRFTSGIFILNTPYTGGGMMIAPDAIPDDGYFDIVIINSISKPRLLYLLTQVYSGKHRNHPQVEFHKARKIIIKASETYCKMFDGSIYGTCPLQIELIPKKFKVLTPKEE